MGWTGACTCEREYYFINWCNVIGGEREIRGDRMLMLCCTIPLFFLFSSF